MTMQNDSDGRRSLIALLILAAAAAGLVYVLIQPFLEPIFFALVLAIAAQPIHRRVTARIGHPILAATTTTLTLLLAVLLPLGALGVTVVNEARQAFSNLQHLSQQDGGWGQWTGHLLDPPIRWVADRTGMPAPRVHDLIVAKAQSYTSMLITWGGSLLGNLTATIGNAVLSLFIMLFLLVEGRAIRKGFLSWMPLKRERTVELITAISDSIVANVYGIAAVGAAQGILTGIGFLFAGLDSPIMWGAIASVCSLVPLVGPALVWLPAAIYLLIQGAWGKALFMLLWGILAVGMVDNIVRPWVLSGKTELNTLVVFFALMGGVQAFGFIGIFAGPVIFSIAICVFRILREEYIDQPSPPEPA